MDINQEKNKSTYNEEQKFLIKLFKFGVEDIELKGSSIKQNIKFFSDYDFFTQIKRNYDIEEIYDEFHKILKNILDNDNTYFIEFKLQKNNGDKIRWFYNDTFNFNNFSKDFNNVDYCKIDIILYSDNRFIDASSIYNFNNKIITNEEYIKNINDDIKELKKENNYFKILKKLYLLYITKNDYNKIEYLQKIFNSELGLIYKNINNIDAIEIIKKYYNDAKTKKKIEVNLKDINYPYNYESEYKKQKIKLNEAGKKYYNILK